MLEEKKPYNSLICVLTDGICELKLNLKRPHYEFDSDMVMSKGNSNSAAYRHVSISCYEVSNENLYSSNGP